MKKMYEKPDVQIRLLADSAAIVTVSTLTGWDDDWNIGNDAVQSDDPQLPFVPF